MLEKDVIRTLTGWMEQPAGFQVMLCCPAGDHAPLGEGTQSSWGASAAFLERRVGRVPDRPLSRQSCVCWAGGSCLWGYLRPLSNADPRK